VQDKSIVLVYVLLGIGYSVYACALWGSIPFVVPEKLLGSAFGLCTAIQNTGLTIVPLMLTLTQNWSKTGTIYNNLSICLLVLFGCIGIIINLLLYFDDIKNRNGVLNKAMSGKKEELEIGMETPKITKADLNVEQAAMFEGDVEFKQDREDDTQKDPNKLSTTEMEKDALKRSMARSFHK
jgi:hypothetical protein